MNKKEFNFDRSLTLEELSDYEITKDLKINLMEDPIDMEKVEEFFETFFRNKKFTTDNYKKVEKEENQENQELFKYYFPLFISLYSVRKNVYDEIISNIDIDEEELAFFEKQIEKKIKDNGISKIVCRKFLLLPHFDVDNALGKLHKAINVANEKGIKEFQKENDKGYRLKIIALTFALIYNEHYDYYLDFIELLKALKKVDEIKIHKFEKEIIEFFRKTEIENLPVEKEIATKIDIMRLGSGLGILHSAFHLGIYKDKPKEKENIEKTEEKSFLN